MSIQSQNFTDWELIAVDDNSSDHSLEIVRTLSQNDPRIRLMENSGAGIISALDMALTNATGAFVGRMDADDIMPQDRLRAMYEKLKMSPPKTIITGLVEYFSDDPISEGYRKYEQWLNMINRTGSQWKNIYRECVIASPNWMTRTGELKAIGGFKELTYPEDYHLVFRWYANGFQIETLDQVTLLWREHPARTSRNSEHYDQEHFFALKISQFVQLDWNREPIVIWGRNPKSKLTAKYLKRHNVPYQIMDLKDYQKILKLPKSQLLVAVYPEEKERVDLETYLNEICRVLGKDWWYL